jgi:hypothetical protein
MYIQYSMDIHMCYILYSGISYWVPGGNWRTFTISVSDILHNQIVFHSRPLTGARVLVHYRQKFTARVFFIMSFYCMHLLTVRMYTPTHCTYVYTYLLYVRIHLLTVRTYAPTHCTYVCTYSLYVRIHLLTVRTYAPTHCTYVCTYSLYVRMYLSKSLLKQTANSCGWRRYQLMSHRPWAFSITDCVMASYGQRSKQFWWQCCTCIASEFIILWLLSAKWSGLVSECSHVGCVGWVGCVGVVML